MGSQETLFFGGDDHLYGAFFRAGVDGVLFLDARGEVLDANAEACRLLGKARGELLAPGGGAIFDPSDPRLGVARGEQGEKGSFRGPLRVLRGGAGSGDTFEAVVTVAGYVDGVGEERVVVVVRDHGRVERHDPEVAARDEEWFLSLARLVGDVVVVFDFDGSCRYVSPSMERMLGYAPEELTGEVALDVIHAEDFERVVATGVEVWSRPGVAPPFTARLRRKDGTWAHIEMAMNNLVEDGRLGGVLVIARDVSERVRAEQEIQRLNAELERRVARRAAELEAAAVELRENRRALQDSEERLRISFEEAPAAIAHISPEGSHLRVNGRFARLAGRPREDLVGRSMAEAVHPEDAEEDAGKRLMVLGGTLDRYTTEKRYRRPDGSYVWLSLNLSAARDPDGFPYLVAVAEDVDARKRAELALGSLTVREMGVLMMLARGRSNPQISADLKISLGTVKHHVGNIMEKLGAKNRFAVVVRVAELGLFRPSR